MGLFLTTAEGATGSSTMSIVSMLLVYGAVIAVFYFLFMRPQKKEQKQKKENLNYYIMIRIPLLLYVMSLKKGFSIMGLRMAIKISL